MSHESWRRSRNSSSAASRPGARGTSAPEVFRAAICMSGTYDMDRFLPGESSEDYYYSSPLHFLPSLDGETLEKLRTRFVLLASGEGRAENIGESWRVAHILGQKGIPNRVDSWGAEWHHDWPTWRNMMPKYLEELVPVSPATS